MGSDGPLVYECTEGLCVDIPVGTWSILGGEPTTTRELYGNVQDAGGRWLDLPSPPSPATDVVDQVVGASSGGLWAADGYDGQDMEDVER